MPATDAKGERDYGSLDDLRVTDDVYMVEGDFGRVAVASAPPAVEILG